MNGRPAPPQEPLDVPPSDSTRARGHGSFLGAHVQRRRSPMRPDQDHRCTVQTKTDGRPYLAFEPSSGASSSYSNSLFTLDLRADVSLASAERLCRAINARLQGVSSTIF
jgi:hypothetical protein